MTTDIHFWLLCEQDPEFGEPQRLPVGFSRHDARNKLTERLLELELCDEYSVDVYGTQGGEQVFSAERGDDFRLLWIEPDTTRPVLGRQFAAGAN